MFVNLFVLKNLSSLAFPRNITRHNVIVILCSFILTNECSMYSHQHSPPPVLYSTTITAICKSYSKNQHTCKLLLLLLELVFKHFLKLANRDNHCC